MDEDSSNPRARTGLTSAATIKHPLRIKNLWMNRIDRWGNGETMPYPNASLVPNPFDADGL